MSPEYAPIEREPRRVRPPHDTPDNRFDHLMTTDPTAWRRAVHLDRVAALLEPLAGVEVSDREHAVVEWIAGFDIHTIAPVVRLLHAARAAAPLADEAAGVADDPRRLDLDTLDAATARLRAAGLSATERVALVDLLGTLGRHIAALPDEVVVVLLAAVTALAVRTDGAQ